jgi:hypothetical protein
MPRMNSIMEQGAPPGRRLGAGADLPARTAGPHLDLKPAAPAPCTARVRRLRRRSAAPAAAAATPATPTPPPGRAPPPLHLPPPVGTVSGAQHTASAEGGGRRRRCGSGSGRSGPAPGPRREPGGRAGHPHALLSCVVTQPRPASFLPDITVLRPPGPGTTMPNSRARWSLGPPRTRPCERLCPSCSSACRRESWSTSRSPW